MLGLPGLSALYTKLRPALHYKFVMHLYDEDSQSKRVDCRTALNRSTNHFINRHIWLGEPKQWLEHERHNEFMQLTSHIRGRIVAKRWA